METTLAVNPGRLARFAANRADRERLNQQSRIFKYLALITICSSMLLAFRPNPSQGIYINLLSRGPDRYPGSTDGDGLLIMTIESKRKIRVWHEYIRYEELGNRLQTVFSTRAEKLLLMKVEGQVEFGDVVEVLDRAISQAPLRFGLITERSTPNPAEPSLFMNGKLIYTQCCFPTRSPIPLH